MSSAPGSSASGSHAHSPEARAVFARMLARVEEGGELDLDRCARETPELADELRALHASHRRVEAGLARLAAGDPPSHDAGDEIGPGGSITGSITGTSDDAMRVRGATERYSIQDEIARGGMGVVLRAHDRDLDRELAMKRIRTGDGVREPRPGSQTAKIEKRALARFLREARITARLDHPGIVPVHDIGVDAAGRAYFTMPLVRGESLADVLGIARDREDRWPEARVIEALLRVCDAVAFAHAAGVVHRDLKPANVMLGRFGEVYVMDWGLARVRDVDARDSGERGAAPDAGAHSIAAHSIDAHSIDAHSTEAHSTEAHSTDATVARGRARDGETRDGAVLGTPAYMSPEQARGDRNAVGPASDVYALGAILYHVLTGAPPYARGPGSGDASAHEIDVLESVLEGPPPAIEALAPDAPSELAAISAKAMSRAVRDRYASVRDMAADLRAYADGRVVSAHATGAWPELEKWVLRNRALAASLAAVCVTIGVALAAIGWVEARGKREVLRLADAQRLAVLERDARALWPAVPERASAMRAWLGDAGALAARATEHEQALASIRDGVEHGSGSAAAERFATAEAQWQHDSLAALVSGLARFADPDPARGAIANVRARLAFAESIQKASIGAHAAEWSEAIASIADRDRCPIYAGLAIEPQLGLVPLGRDPRSGLWEFAHLASGTSAVRDHDGALRLDAESGVVLVLVPGGSFTMGSERPVPGRPSGPRADPWARDDERPSHEASVAPYFVSKFELTRAQWDRSASGVPSTATGERATTALLPRTDVAWEDARQAMFQVGLELPTECQWEYAARAGTVTRWSTGNDATALLGAANARYGTENLRAFEDGYEELAPVDALAPNPWGLFHVHGNVAEWTASAKVPFAPSEGGALARGLETARDAEVRVDRSGVPADDRRAEDRVVRGGSYTSSIADLRSAARASMPASNHAPDVGLRPVRALDPR